MWSLVAAILGSGIVFLDGTVVTVALPAIGTELPRVSSLGVLEAQSYVFSVYMLSLSALLVVGGVLSDSWGRRRMYQWGLIGFAVSSALCGLAPNMEFLIAGRALQGLAGALLIPGSLALINGAYEDEARARAFGVWTGATAAVTIVGPLVGGALVDAVSWRAAFLVNLPVLAVAWWVTHVKVEEPVDSLTHEHVDWWGAVLAGLAVAGLTFGPVRGQEAQWEGPGPWIMIGAGLVGLVFLVARIRHHPRPLVPASLFASKAFNVVNVATFLIYGALYVLLYLTSIYLQGTVGYNATAAGLATLPQMIPLALFSSAVGSAAASTGPRPWLVGGSLVMAVAAVWLSRVPPDSSAWVVGADTSSWIPPTDYLTDVLGPILLFGLGLMAIVTPLTTTLMGSVAPERAGVGSAFNNAVSRIGPQLLGAAAVVIVTVAFYGQLQTLFPDLDFSAPETRATLAPLNAPGDVSPELASAARDASGVSFGRAMWLAAGLLVVAAGVCAVGLEREHPDGPAARRLGGQICVPEGD